MIELIHDWVIIDENMSLQDQQLNEKSYIKMVIKNEKNKKKICEDKKFEKFNIYCDIDEIIRKMAINSKDFDLNLDS